MVVSGWGSYNGSVEKNPDTCNCVTLTDVEAQERVRLLGKRTKKLIDYACVELILFSASLSSTLRVKREHLRDVYSFHI
jgi:hypothetical protein